MRIKSESPETREWYMFLFFSLKHWCRTTQEFLAVFSEVSTVVLVSALIYFLEYIPVFIQKLKALLSLFIFPPQEQPCEVGWAEEDEDWAEEDEPWWRSG